jgi:acetylornithine/succinyldiaminopimelate/putrescine aminotransferase/predicted amino acid dehydrogenase
MSNALNPTLRRLLDRCGFDRTWARGDGAWLTDGAGRRFLDFYAQYGAVALGHNAPAVTAAVRAALEASTPAMVQPYRAPHAEALAARLAARAGLAQCTFTTSGAEAVEAALKLVRARTRRPIVISAEGSFHGKTTGALAATGQRQYAVGFGPEAPGFLRVPFGDLAALERAMIEHGGETAGLLLEPIQGERGVHLPPAGYLSAARALCSKHGVALILDEIQSGLGRTGKMFACEHEGVVPDLLLLAKGLGGGLFPLGACLSSAAWWDDGFGLRHSSTFANNDAACRVGLAVLDALEDLGDAVARRGERLLDRLRALQLRHPRVLADTRGRGLLAAVELCALDAEAGSFLGYFDHQGLLAYAAAAAMAERSGVLVLPSLGDGRVLRFAPPLIVGDEDIDRAVDALADLCVLLERRDGAAVARAIGATTPRESERVTLPAPAPQPRRPHSYAFVLHYTSEEDMRVTDPSFVRLGEDELRAYAQFAGSMPAGVVLRAPPVRSRTGEVAEGWIIAVPMLPQQMARAGRREMRDRIIEAVDLAAALGAGVVGLGGYTTAYAQRGRLVVGRGPTITTGNTLTGVMAFEGLREAARWQGRSIGRSRVAVVGARGSVGALCARLAAAERPGQLVLIGNPASSSERLERLAEEIAWSRGAVTVTTAIDAVAECELVISATGAARPALAEAPLRRGAIVCDVARPYDTTQAQRISRDLTVVDGGLVALPDPTLRFGAGNLQGYPDGTQLACLSETIVLALSGATADAGVGDDITLFEAARTRELAERHGFRLAAPSLGGAMLARERA